MSTELDPQQLAATAGGGILGLGALILWAKRLLRIDKREEVIDETWITLINQLKEEVGLLKKEVELLKVKVKECEEDKLNLLNKVLGFEKRFGTRLGEFGKKDLTE